MGGLFLIAALIGVYLVVYWSIDIELKSDKTKGLLGFIPEAIEKLHNQNNKPKSYGFLKYDLADENQEFFKEKKIPKADNFSNKKEFINADAQVHLQFRKNPSQENNQKTIPQPKTGKKPFLKK